MNEKIYKGSEVLETELKMQLKAVLDAFLVALFVQLFIIFLLIMYKIGLHNFMHALYMYMVAKYYTAVHLQHAFLLYNSTTNTYAYYPATVAVVAYAQYVSILLHKIYVYIILSFLVHPAVIPVFLRVFKSKADKVSEEKVIRGADITQENRVAKTLPKPWRLPISEKIAIPVAYETQHILVAGKTGVGKTTLISQQLLKLKKEKVIVYDFKGDYLNKFYDPAKDHIFNPIDSRSVEWSVANDIENEIDIASIVESLIPSNQIDQERYWLDAAQAVFIAILKTLFKQQQGKVSNVDIWQTLSLSGTDLVKFLKQYQSQNAKALQFLSDGKNSQAAGVLSSLLRFAGVFEYLAMEDGVFSFKKWIESDDAGWLFITNNPKVKNLLRPALSMVIDLLIREILSLPDDRDRRVFLVLDEFATLQPLPSIIDFITLARSKGGVAILGVQDLGRVKKLYGIEETKTIVNNCANHILFSTTGETSEEFSKLIGEKEVEEMQQNYSMGPEEMRDGISLARVKRQKRVVLASELAKLPAFRAFCKLAEGQLFATDIKKSFVVAKDIPAFIPINNISDNKTEVEKEIDD